MTKDERVQLFERKLYELEKEFDLKITTCYCCGIGYRDELSDKTYWRDNNSWQDGDTNDLYM